MISLYQMRYRTVQASKLLVAAAAACIAHTCHETPSRLCWTPDYNASCGQLRLPLLRGTQWIHWIGIFPFQLAIQRAFMLYRYSRSKELVGNRYSQCAETATSARLHFSEAKPPENPSLAAACITQKSMAFEGRGHFSRHVCVCARNWNTQRLLIRRCLHTRTCSL